LEIALSNNSGLVDWHSVDPEIYDNPGASSMFLINFRNRRLGDPDRNRSKIQTLMTVKASRFDDLDLPVPNLIAMDVQGAELAVLHGFGTQLQAVSAIILETSLSENYVGGSKFKDIDLFLTNQGFSFQRSSLAKNSFEKPKTTLPVRFGFYSPDFNVLYTKSS